MEFIKREWFKICLLLLIIISLMALAFYASFRAQSEKNPTENNVNKFKETINGTTTTKLSVKDGVHLLIENYAYGPGVEIVAIDEKRILFTPPHQTEGCNKYASLNLETGDQTVTNLSSCPNISVATSYPFYIEDCTYSDCYDFKTLYVVNLLTMERKSVHVVATTTETTIWNCHESDYDPICASSITYENGVLNISIYKAQARKKYEVYDNQLLRTDKINLYDLFDFKHK